MPLWVRFSAQDGRTRRGTLDGDRIAVHAGGIFDPLSPTGETRRSVYVALLPPCEPGNIVALWNNFHALAAKLEKKPPRHPLFLIKPATSVAGPGSIRDGSTAEIFIDGIGTLANTLTARW